MFCPARFYIISDMQKRIILASASGGRKKLLEELGIKFEVIPSEYEEDHSLQMNPHEFVKFLATLKARDVASRVDSAFVIGADTMVVFEKEIIGKPKNAKEASEILQKLQGKTHKVITGYAVFDTDKDKYIVDSDEATVTLRPLTEKEIREYVETGEYVGKAGGYASQGKASVFIEKISGHFSTVVGLPIHKLTKSLSKMGYDIVDDWKNK